MECSKKRKHGVRAVAFILCAVFMAGLLSPLNARQAQAASKQNWRSAYQGILTDWRQVERYQDTSYLKQYFGEGYRFDRYYLYDLDKNGTPELFLNSRGMGLTVVLTYKNGLKSLGYEALDRIHKGKKELIVHGHWHGAGGSGTDEWSVYRVSGNKMSLTYYIDRMAGYYYVYDYRNNTSSDSRSAYNKIYKEHVKTASKISGFKKYKLSDHTGLAVYGKKPAKTTVRGLTARKKGFRVKWKKRKANTKGYEIQYAGNRKFKNAKKVTVRKKGFTAKTIRGLKGKKRYYVRVRVYNTVKVNGKTKNVYSGWSARKSVVTKK